MALDLWDWQGEYTVGVEGSSDELAVSAPVVGLLLAVEEVKDDRFVSHQVVVPLL